MWCRKQLIQRADESPFLILLSGRCDFPWQAVRGTVVISLWSWFKVLACRSREKVGRLGAGRKQYGTRDSRPWGSTSFSDIHRRWGTANFFMTVSSSSSLLLLATRYDNPQVFWKALLLRLPMPSALSERTHGYQVGSRSDSRLRSWLFCFRAS